MKFKRKAKQALNQVLLIGLLLTGAFLILSFLTYESPSKLPQKSSPLISEEVRNYEPLVVKYAKEYDVTEHVNVLMSMMMQESGGRGTDPMQSSESYCGQVGCIEDPELSIKQGVYYFSETLEEAEGDLKLAIQSYNFGRGFIEYVHEQTGTYSVETAIDFSQHMYENAPDQSIYTCLRKEAKQYDACYGDIYYVQSVMQYRDVLALE